MGSNGGSKQANKAFKHYFDRAAARQLADQIAGVEPTFDCGRFVRTASRGLSQLEFMGRVKRFSDTLATTLPEDIPRALAILSASLPEPLADCEAVMDGWLQWPVGQFIADHGLPHFEESMAAMVALTKRFSSEFAVRPFVEQRPDETFDRLLALTTDPNPHVRRWCSEGIRPRLPWGRKLVALVKNPTPVWPILDALRDDEERYVQRSVANNLNDIAKDHPQSVVKKCRSWLRSSTLGRRWIVNHGLRSLVKTGNPDALAVIGFKAPRNLSARLSVFPKQIQIGEGVELSLDLHSAASVEQQLLVDYAIEFIRKNGTISSKVFKWKRISAQPEERLSLKKKHSMRATTVRELYPGRHRIELQINGQRFSETSFFVRK